MDVMVDIETLATSHHAHVVSIGAQIFDPFARDTWDTLDRIGRGFHLVLDPNQNRTISPNTVIWWMQQSEQARAVFHVRPVKIQTALASFSGFCHGCKYLWGNGATFDNVILRDLYKQYGYDFPFHFRADRDYRTIRMLAEFAKGNVKPENIPQDRVAHDALQDAKKQVLMVQAYYRALRLEDNEANPS